MWDILVHYGLEYIFGAQKSTFEIAGEYVQTTVPGNATPQTIGKATVEPTIDVVTNPSLVCVRPEDTTSRHYVQFGFNPFGPVIQKGAEEFLILVGQDPYSKGEVY